MRRIIPKIAASVNRKHMGAGLSRQRRLGARLEAARKKEALRLAIVPDFLIGAHAMECADALVTRDRGFMRRWFSDLKIVDPSVH